MRFKIKSQHISKDLDRIRVDLPRITKSAHRQFVKVTPIDTGNAKRSTRVSGNVINAAYEYANRLNNGWSRQAPKGMTEPTVEYLRKLVKRLLGDRR